MEKSKCVEASCGCSKCMGHCPHLSWQCWGSSDILGGDVFGWCQSTGHKILSSHLVIKLKPHENFSTLEVRLTPNYNDVYASRLPPSGRLHPVGRWKLEKPENQETGHTNDHGTAWIQAVISAASSSNQSPPLHRRTQVDYMLLTHFI